MVNKFAGDILAKSYSLSVIPKVFVEKQQLCQSVCHSKLLQNSLFEEAFFTIAFHTLKNVTHQFMYLFCCKIIAFVNLECI